ncbi:MAG: hypothetical protein HOV80_24745, partial [Polyangiaceae bacterium]|nr:hypothetical protein [Polyangiaceae bacterium]
MTARFASSPDTDIPVVVTFKRRPTAGDLAAIEAGGARIARDTQGRPLGRGKFITANVDITSARAIAALPFVKSVQFDGPPVATPRPDEFTAGLISADATWRSHLEGGSALTGKGVTICDVDNGTDIMHPLFFRADGGYFEWIDTNNSGRLEPDVDQVDLGNGPVTIRAVNGIVWDRRTGDPLWGTDAPA